MRATVLNRGGLYSVPLTVTLPGRTMGIDTGPDSDGVQLGVMTPQTPDQMLIYDASTGTYVAAAATDAEVASGDGLYWTNSEPFCGIQLVVGTKGQGTVTSVAWQYWNGSAWSTLTCVDNSVKLTAVAGTYVMCFAPPSDWATTTLNGEQNQYCVRLHVGAASQYGTDDPVVTTGKVYTMTDAVGPAVGVEGYIDKVYGYASANAGAAADSKFLLINATKGKWETLTWTKGTPEMSFTSLELPVSNGDQLVIRQVAEDGTDEIANLSFIINMLLY